jgi:hypothetical protein
MTDAEFNEIFRLAEAGNTEALKQATFLCLQLANVHMQEGRMDQANLCMTQADTYKRQAMAADPTWIP